MSVSVTLEELVTSQGVSGVLRDLAAYCDARRQQGTVDEQNYWASCWRVCRQAAVLCDDKPQQPEVQP